MKIAIRPFMNKTALVFFLICLTLFFACTKVTDITLDKRELTLFPGDVETLSAIVYPKNATNKKITWWNTDPDVATVNNVGEVTAVSAGQTLIFVASKDGNSYIEASCNVVVHRSNYIGNWDFVVERLYRDDDLQWKYDTIYYLGKISISNKLGFLLIEYDENKILDVLVNKFGAFWTNEGPYYNINGQFEEDNTVHIDAKFITEVETTLLWKADGKKRKDTELIKNVTVAYQNR